tara:strand:- start:2965 stop:3858 length:894 start_codon:yes stop_codon:yes gene_type:complete
MSTLNARAVFVTRETDYELLINRHATIGQARFFLKTRGQQLSTLEDRHEHFSAVLKQARAAIPDDWRQTLVRRADLDRFLFAEDDLVIAIGQDGLVANVAKYLRGQNVVGVNPDPILYDGVLARHHVGELAGRLEAIMASDCEIERRTMVEGVLDNGQKLVALNELFVGHRSHQSARYQIVDGEQSENHSSSGLIVASGTGTTGWARSIMEATGQHLRLAPSDQALAYFVREPFPSVSTGTSLRSGKVHAKPLEVTSRMNDGGVIFADGMEQDFLSFDWGRSIAIGISAQVLNLVLD